VREIKRRDMNEESICLKRMDHENKALDTCVRNLRDEIRDDNTFEALVHLFKSSKYWPQDFAGKYEAWKRGNSDYALLDAKMQSAFDRAVQDCFAAVSGDIELWDKLRGMFAEKVVETAFGNWYKKNIEGYKGEIELGCAVCLGGRIVKHKCAEDMDQQELCGRIRQSCKPAGECKGDKQTVDIGSLVYMLPPQAGRALYCLETKLTPKSFHYLDADFLKKLKDTLDEIGVHTNIIIASLDYRQSLEERVVLCMGEEAPVEIWGVAEIKSYFFDK